MKRVEIIFNKDGSVVVEAKEFQGQSCEKATEFIDRIFGKGDRKHKASYYQEDLTKVCDGLPGGWCG